MAVDFNILARVPTIGSQIMAGQEAGREAAARNMLLQQRATEFQQAQEDRSRKLEAERLQTEARPRLAQMLRQMGQNPGDLKAATEFTAAAFESNNAAAVTAGQEWIKLARELAAPEKPVVVGGRLVSPTGRVLYEPSPGAMTPTERFVPVGPNVFNRETGEFLPGPAREPALRQAPEARVKPAAPIRVRPGEVVISPETGQTIFTAPPAPARAPAARAAAAPGAPAVGTPAQQAVAARQRTAQANLSQDIRTQLGYYEKLAEMGAMTSPTRSVAENVAAFARSSGIGQQAERAIATEAQTLRDNIKNTRQRLFLQMKDATGATASQMNSNAEMQAWLNSMTDPQQSIETVRETLKQMDYVIAGMRDQVAREAAAKGGAGAAPAAAPTAPAPAAVNRREIAPGVFVTERP